MTDNSLAYNSELPNDNHSFSIKKYRGGCAFSGSGLKKVCIELILPEASMLNISSTQKLASPRLYNRIRAPETIKINKITFVLIIEEIFIFLKKIIYLIILL